MDVTKRGPIFFSGSHRRFSNTAGDQVFFFQAVFTVLHTQIFKEMTEINVIFNQKVLMCGDIILMLSTSEKFNFKSNFILFFFTI